MSGFFGYARSGPHRCRERCGLSFAMTRPVLGGDTLYARTGSPARRTARTAISGSLALVTKGINQCGETIRAMSKIAGKRESAKRPDRGILHVETSAHGKDGTPVCRFKRALLVYRRGAGPYLKAGY